VNVAWQSPGKTLWVSAFKFLNAKTQGIDRGAPVPGAATSATLSAQIISPTFLLPHVAAAGDGCTPGCSVEPAARNRRTAPTLQRFARTPSKGGDWSWRKRIMPAKSGWREGTRVSGFGVSRQKRSNDKVSLFE